MRSRQEVRFGAENSHPNFSAQTSASGSQRTLSWRKSTGTSHNIHLSDPIVSEGRRIGFGSYAAEIEGLLCSLTVVPMLAKVQ